ncbi:MAG: glycosyltransferase family 2 protein [Clostridium sp.]|nr:glycosyltransferase family 2 protein [Clostridium sp.]
MEEILYLVVPCYNEEEVLIETSKRLLGKINKMINEEKISKKSKILFVNDGSKDKTWDMIEELYNKNSIFSGVNLSRNRGHQNALLAGLMVAKEYADMVISLDADLQDDIDVIEKFVEEYYSGSDIVYGVRSSRKTDTFFKRTTALGFYKFMDKLGVNVVYNHADYRLMSKRALEALAEFKEVNLFLRGIVPLIGYKYSIVEYERHERFAGESKYPLKKMLAFAIDGITSFSVKPIRLISVLGFSIFFISLIALIYSLVVKFLGKTEVGWTSIVISIWMLGGIQLLSLGVIGEYIGKIYNETKARPRYIIKDKLIRNKEEKINEYYKQNKKYIYK